LNTSLTQLSLYNAGLNDSAAQTLGDYIENNTSLHTLCIAANPICTIKPISDALKFNNRTLKNVMVTEIPAKNLGSSIGDAMTNNDSVISLSVGYWGSNNEEISSLFNKLKSNTSIIGVGTTWFINQDSILAVADCLKNNNILKSFKYMNNGKDKDNQSYSYEQAMEDLKNNVSENRLMNFKLIKGCI